jgi:hypothetical protein
MRVSIGARDHRGASLAARAGNDDEDDLFSFLEAQMAEENGGADEEEAGSIPTANSIMGEEGSPMSGEELRLLVLNKWGKMYDTRIHQRRDQFNKLQLYLQIMWKHVGQKSFPLTETAYVEQLDAVAELLTEWGAQDVVRQKDPAVHQVPKDGHHGRQRGDDPVGNRGRSVTNKEDFFDDVEWDRLVAGGTRGHAGHSPTVSI